MRILKTVRMTCARRARRVVDRRRLSAYPLSCVWVRKYSRAYRQPWCTCMRMCVCMFIGAEHRTNNAISLIYLFRIKMLSELKAERKNYLNKRYLYYKQYKNVKKMIKNLSQRNSLSKLYIQCKLHFKAYLWKLDLLQIQN